jgi:hypothetical protein
MEQDHYFAVNEEDFAKAMGKQRHSFDHRIIIFVTAKHRKYLIAVMPVFTVHNRNALSFISSKSRLFRIKTAPAEKR